MPEQYKITSIEPQKKRKDRFSVFLDDSFALGVSADVLLEFGLAQGQEISAAFLEKIRQAEEMARLREAAFRLLSYRARSVYELTMRLRQKQYDEHAVDRVVDEFVSKGYLDDLEFSMSFVRSRMALRPAARKLLVHELAGKGVEGSVARQAVEQAYGDTAELDVARKLVQKKSGIYRAGNAGDRKRLYSFLQRRGFAAGIIKQAIETEWEKEG